QQLGDGVDQATHPRGPLGRHEERECSLSQVTRHLAHAVRMHGVEELAQRAHAFAAGAAGTSEMLLDAAARGFIEPLLEEVQRHAGGEVAVPDAIGLHEEPPMRRTWARWSALLTLTSTGGVSGLADTIRIPLDLLKVAPQPLHAAGPRWAQ